MDILTWFHQWRDLHEKLVAKGAADEYNFFADETWFCIRALLLSHVAAIEIYSVQKKMKIRPGSMNTDAVEWFFGDLRSMVTGATNKVTAKMAYHGGKKCNAFNEAKMKLIGNNASVKDNFGRQKCC